MTSTEYQALAVHVRSIALLAAYRELLRELKDSYWKQAVRNLHGATAQKYMFCAA